MIWHAMQQNSTEHDRTTSSLHSNGCLFKTRTHETTMSLLISYCSRDDMPCRWANLSRLLSLSVLFIHGIFFPILANLWLDFYVTTTFSRHDSHPLAAHHIFSIVIVSNAPKIHFEQQQKTEINIWFIHAAKNTRVQLVSASMLSLAHTPSVLICQFLRIEFVADVRHPAITIINR